MKKQIGLSAFIGLLVLGGCSGVDTPPNPSLPNPGDVTLISPEKNKTCEAGSIISDLQREVFFSWSAAPNADFYDLRITDLNTNIVTIVDKIIGTNTKVVLKKGTPYSWNLISRSGKSTMEGKSESWNFYLAGTGISNYAPFPATIVSPLPGATISPTLNKIKLSWKGADPENDKLTYTVYLDSIDGKQQPLASLTDLSTSTIEVALETGKIYYWRIRSSDGSNASTTIVYQFKIP